MSDGPARHRLGEPAARRNQFEISDVVGQGQAYYSAESFSGRATLGACGGARDSDALASRFVQLPSVAGTAASTDQVASVTGSANATPRLPKSLKVLRRQSEIAAKYMDRSRYRFLRFSFIGGSVFLLGFGLQALLTSVWHISPQVSYLAQAVVSVEVSFLLNRWVTWRDRSMSFWLACARFNAQKALTIALNLALYFGLLRLNINYLVANILLTVGFTVVNFIAGDRLVFIPDRERGGVPGTAALTVSAEAFVPGVSVVIPCRDNEDTIAATLHALLQQTYPGIREILLIGSPGDTTWDGLRGMTDADPRITIMEFRTPPGVRDANFKRDTAIRMTTSELVALVDSDVVLPPDWMSRAVATLQQTRASCVTGGMKRIRDDFWSRFTDETVIGAKTPRVTQTYEVTAATFGRARRKPPISANVIFARNFYQHCPIDPAWTHGSYEDYEWFWRVVKRGFHIVVSADLYGWHHHRHGMRALAREYFRSSRGCAYFIEFHPDSPLARLRSRQAFLLPVATLTAIAAAAAMIVSGHGPIVAFLVLAGAAALAAHQFARSHRLESITYPALGMTLGLIFTAGLVMHLMRLATLRRRVSSGPETSHEQPGKSPPCGKRSEESPDLANSMRHPAAFISRHPFCRQVVPYHSSLLQIVTK